MSLLAGFIRGVAPAGVVVDSSGVEVKKWGLIDINGNIILQPEYDWIFNFDDNWTTVRSGNALNYLNTKGEFLFEFSPNWVKNSGNGLFPYRGAELWYVVDKDNVPQFCYSRSMTMKD